MEFIEFRKDTCGIGENNVSKATIGLIYYVPVKSDNDDNTYEYSIDKMYTLSRPIINLYYITDPFTSIEFIELNIEFSSNYDPEISEIYNFMKGFEDEVTKNVEDISKCPAFSVVIMPNKELKEHFRYLEMNMPIMTSLISNKQNKMPNIISALFTVDNCSFHEEEVFDIEEVDKEILQEKRQEDERIMREAEEEEERMLKIERMNELQAQLNGMTYGEKVFRSDLDEDTEYEENN